MDNRNLAGVDKFTTVMIANCTLESCSDPPPPRQSQSPLVTTNPLATAQEPDGPGADPPLTVSHLAYRCAKTSF